MSSKYSTPSPTLFQHLQYEQNSLDKLCAKRPLDWTEYHHMNHFHGNHSILARHANWDNTAPLPFGIEHAIPYDLDEAYSYDIDSGLSTFFAVHERSADLYRKKAIPYVTPIGFTYLYTLKLYQELHPNNSTPKRKGTLVFPDKSTLLMETDFNREKLIELLSTLPEEYQPVTICIYWKDYLRGTHLPFKKAGFPIVSAGHILDPDFQLRLHDLCRHFKYSCANDIAGSFTLSILSGCHFFFLDTGPVTQKKHGKTNTYKIDPTLTKPIKKQCREASPFPPQDNTVQLQLARENAGISYQKSKEELKDLFEDAHQRLKSKTIVKSISFNTDFDKQTFLSLLPSGIDPDGWARNQASLTIPIHTDTQSITVKIEFPGWSPVKKQFLKIFINNLPYCEIILRLCVKDITIPITDSDVSSLGLKFQALHDFSIDENRNRSFRFHSLQLISSSSSDQIFEP